MPAFSFNYKNSQALQTLFTQEMLKRNFLATRTIYVTYSHKEKHVKDYLAKIDEVFGILVEAIKTDTVEKCLEGPIAHEGFKRLN
jgi:hypothetical protein